MLCGCNSCDVSSTAQNARFNVPHDFLVLRYIFLLLLSIYNSEINELEFLKKLVCSSFPSTKWSNTSGIHLETIPKTLMSLLYLSDFTGFFVGAKPSTSNG